MEVLVQKSSYSSSGHYCNALGFRLATRVGLLRTAAFSFAMFFKCANRTPWTNKPIPYNSMLIEIYDLFRNDIAGRNCATPWHCKLMSNMYLYLHIGHIVGLNDDLSARVHSDPALVKSINPHTFTSLTVRHSIASTSQSSHTNMKIAKISRPILYYLLGVSVENGPPAGLSYA